MAPHGRGRLRVLVLGGTGMLGHVVARELSLDPLLRVEATQRSSRPALLWLDAEDGAPALRALFKRTGPYAYLINCIGVIKAQIDETDLASVRRAVIVNALFPHDLSLVASETGAKVIHISTDGVFAGTADAYFEDAPHDCTDVYGKTKSLGEVRAPGFLTIRCSIVGPDPLHKRGLLEWLRGQPRGSVLTGYDHHLWNGVTTLQFARLCHEIICCDRFAQTWRESPVHHFCPNRPVSKYELLEILRAAYGVEVTIVPSSAEVPPVCRVLKTRYHSLASIMGRELSVEDAIRQLRQLDPSPLPTS